MSIGVPFVAELGAWFARPTSRPDASSLLFCLPYSGAGATVFEPWSRHLPAAIEVVGVRLPGREQRIGEPSILDPDHIAAAIAARADRPYAIYGHSLGARLGFEVIRRLRRMDVAQPVLFYPAAAWPPDVADRIAGQVERPYDEFLDTLIARLSAPTELRDEPELRELLLPALRADFTWIHRHRFQAEPPLDLPMVALAGDADHEIGASAMRGWARHTSASFQLRVIPGDHFFVRTATARLAAMFSADLLGAGTSSEARR